MATGDLPPRYRIEHRHPDLSPLIVGFAPTLKAAHLTVATMRRMLRPRGVRDGALVIVDQETEADLKRFPLA